VLRSSPILHAEPFAPAKMIIVPIDLDEAPAFYSESMPAVPAVRDDRVALLGSSPLPPSSAVSVSWTAKERPLLIWLGLVVCVIAGGAVSALAMAALGTPTTPLPPTGAVTVTSEPSGAPVTIDGEARGSTPLATALMPGSHVVEVGVGTEVRRLLQVTRGGDLRIHVEWQTPELPASIAPPATAAPVIAAAPREIPTRSDKLDDSRPADSRPETSGWLTITSPFPVQILDDGKEVGTSTSPRIALPAGERTLVFVNAALEFREERQVSVVARKKTALGIDAPTGILHINARPWAEVWIDGRRLGETPLGNVTLPIGEHDVVFRHPGHPEKRTTVTVGARAAVRVTMEFEP
jgi:hypothetical protein